jgi:hypothetical protein
MHCTFCGLNGATMAFRSKTPSRVLEELEHLQARHGARMVSVVDDILDMSFFRSVLPRIAEAGLGLEMFWEVKANLTVEQVRLLRDAGVTMIVVLVALGERLPSWKAIADTPWWAWSGSRWCRSSWFPDQAGCCPSPYRPRPSRRWCRNSRWRGHPRLRYRRHTETTPERRRGGAGGGTS